MGFVRPLLKMQQGGKAALLSQVGSQARNYEVSDTGASGLGIH
jgi:hypothetical protein